MTKRMVDHPVMLECGCENSYAYSVPRPGDELVCLKHGATRVTGGRRVRAHVDKGDQGGPCLGGCGRTLVASRAMGLKTKAEAASLREQGFARHSGRGLCSMCATRQARALARQG